MERFYRTIDISVYHSNRNSRCVDTSPPLYKKQKTLRGWNGMRETKSYFSPISLERLKFPLAIILSCVDKNPNGHDKPYIRNS
jgi:hypothetical protein